VLYSGRRAVLMASLMLGLMPLSACDKSQAQAEGTQAPAASHIASGWANSADEFRQRWNALTKPVYALSPFQAKKASFSDGAVTYMSNGMITVDTDDHQAVGAICVIAYMAAYGSDHDEAHVIVDAAIQDGHASEESGSGFMGSKTYNGHMMGVTMTASGKVTCTFLNHAG